MARLGTALLVLGMLALGYGGLWQLGLAPGSRVMLPAPLALQNSGRAVSEVSTPLPVAPPPVQPPRPTLSPVQPPTPESPIVQAPPPALPRHPRPDPAIPPVHRTPALARLAAADAADRYETAFPESAYAVRLAIPAIQLDTVVK